MDVSTPLEDHPSSAPSCVRDGSLFSIMVKPKVLLADRRQPEPILSEPCKKQHHAFDELNRSNTRGKHSKNINPHNHMWSRSEPTPTHITAHDGTVGKRSRKQNKNRAYTHPRSIWRCITGWDHDRYHHRVVTEEERASVDCTWVPRTIDERSLVPPTNSPRIEDRKHDLSTWLQACNLHDPATLRHPELIVAGELEVGDYNHTELLIMRTRGLATL